MTQDIKYRIILHVVANTTNNEFLKLGFVFFIVGIGALLIVIKSPFEGSFKVHNYTTGALGILGIIMGIYYIIQYFIVLFS